jgi:PLAC8 family
MLQHSRIRATYDIDGTTADDCCSAYCCPCCTIMQDDREIRAREYKDGKNEKKCDAVNDQPPAQPDMQYAASHLFIDEPVQHRGSLVREKPTATVTGQNQSSRGHGPKGENQERLEHSQHHHEHKKLNKTPKVDTTEHKPKEKGRMAYHNHQRGVSDGGSTCSNSPAYPDQGERDHSCL